MRTYEFLFTKNHKLISKTNCRIKFEIWILLWTRLLRFVLHFIIFLVHILNAMHFFLFVSACVALTGLFFPIVPAVALSILNAILNLKNDTYKRSLAFQIEYFVDLDEHFTFPFLHTIFSCWVMCTFVSVVGSVYIIFTYHNIAIFNAVG